MYYRVAAPTCNVRGFCQYGIVPEFEDGAPGTIRWRVPRTLMPNATQGDVLDGIYAYSWTIDREQDIRARWSATTAPGTETASQSTTPGYASDVTANGTAFVFATPLAAMPLAPLGDGVVLDAPDDLRRGLARPDMDFLSTRVFENETHIGLVFEVAEVLTEPATGDHLLGFGVDLRLSTGVAVIAGENLEGETAFRYARRCGDAFCARAGDIPATFERAPGTPGTVTVAFERGHLGSPPRGTLVNFANAFFALWDGVRDRATEDGVGFVIEQYMGEDFIADLPPYALRYGDPRAAGANSSHTILTDAVGDVAYVVPEGVPRPRFDVSFVEVEPTGPATTRVLLGVMNLDQTAPPPPYDAVIYAVAVETADGPFLVAFYHDTQNVQKFFCSQDTLVLTSPKRNPLDGVAKDIQGAIALGQATDTDSELGGGRSGASIAFDVPHDCFARPPGPFEGLRLAGATYGLQNPTGRSGQAIVDRPLDEAVREEPFMVQFVAPPAPPEAWYVAPFGVANFWDITGVAAAVAVSGAGLVAIDHRRRRLRRWIGRIETAAAEHADAPAARASALVALRGRLRDDVLRGRISEGHYVVVERRLDDELTRARIASIGEAFRELPYWLVAKLQDVLADGVMTKDDVRVFSAAVAETSLTDAEKAEIRARLEKWATQDRPVAP